MLCTLGNMDCAQLLCMNRKYGKLILERKRFVAKFSSFKELKGIFRRGINIQEVMCVMDLSIISN